MYITPDISNKQKGVNRRIARVSKPEDILMGYNFLHQRAHSSLSLA
jgi:hypothetical protein